PDQALCVGAGFVVEAVNTALRVYDTNGTSLGEVAALNAFYGLPPEINRTTLTYGDFTSDPKCHFDADLQRFFVTLLQADVDPSTGDFTGRTSVLLAVSKTSDPRGAWHHF